MQAEMGSQAGHENRAAAPFSRDVASGCALDFLNLGVAERIGQHRRVHCPRSAAEALSLPIQEHEMTDSDRSEHDIDSPADLPIQPTGNGVTDMEIAKLQAAVDDGAEDPSIETPVPDERPTVSQA
jgi:hypothetical protein